jgi:ligand-binding sensor domain-containing protein
MKINILFFLLINFFLSYGQKVSFVNYSVEDGLSQSEVNCIYEDHRGFIWIGTKRGGLDRFDGITFLNYNENNGLESYCINSICEDSNNTLWIGTDDGLYFFNGKKFQRFIQGIFSSKINVSTLSYFKREGLWIGTRNNGVFIWNNKTLQPIIDSSKSPDLNCLFVDEIKYFGLNKKFLKKDKKKDIEEKILRNLKDVNVQSICKDASGEVWIATYNYGLIRLSNTKISQYTVNDGLPSNTVLSVINSSDGKTWAGTRQGLALYDGNKFTVFKTTDGLASDNIKCLFQDSENNIWIGTSGGGVSKLGSNRFLRYSENKDLGKWIYSIRVDKKQNIWIGSSLLGVTKYDGVKFTHYTSKDGFVDEKVRAIHCDKDGVMWFGTEKKGVYSFDGALFKRYIIGEEGSDYISCITSDNYERIWVGSLDNHSTVSFIDKKTSTVTNVLQEDSSSMYRVRAINIDNSENLWIGYEWKGINKISLNDTSWQIAESNIYSSLNELTVNCIASKDGFVYIGTVGEGIKLLKNDTIVKTINKSDGLYANIINFLIFDSSGHLWVGTDKGINRVIFSETNFRILKYGKHEGFVSIETSQNAASIDTIGNLWFGTINGFYKYCPQNDTIKIRKPKIYFTDLKIFYNSILKNDSIAYIEQLKKLELEYDQNHISFDFIGINYANPKAVTYEWMLKGFDKTFCPKTFERTATYSNLRPGSYTLVVRAYSENSDDDDFSVIEFSFTIKKPFWQEYWFYSIIIIFIIFTFFLIIIWLNREHSKKMKTVELENQNLHLEHATYRLQMNPHFIFNSLNSIKGHISTNDIEDAKSYLAKFAKLMRLILENSKEELIPLSVEIEILENYIILEKLRMNDKFDYSIKIEDGIIPDEIEIPPMIIQPLVENAIVHGLKNKNNHGLLELNFKIDGNYLLCEIEDNGIGRKKANEINKITASEHKSSAMKITKQRLQIINKNTNVDDLIKIIDIDEENTNKTGTIVIIKILIL